jgi:hypothetical protein
MYIRTLKKDEGLQIGNVALVILKDRSGAGARLAVETTEDIVFVPAGIIPRHEPCGLGNMHHRRQAELAA